MRNIVQRYAPDTCRVQGFGIGEKIADHRVERSDNAALDIAGRPGEHDVENKLKLMHWLAHIRYFEVP